MDQVSAELQARLEAAAGNFLAALKSAIAELAPTDVGCGAMPYLLLVARLDGSERG